MSKQRLIDASALITAIKKPSIYNINQADFISLVDEQPTVEPKRGEWIRHNCFINIGTGKFPCIPHYRCSICKYDARYGITRYCPDCGADMRGEKE